MFATEPKCLEDGLQEIDTFLFEKIQVSYLGEAFDR